MKKPEEIKKWLECCSITPPKCNECPAYIENCVCDFSIVRCTLAYIQQLEAQVPKWISVEERLPEDGRYLVLTEKAGNTKKVHTATYNSLGWWTYANFGEITHWMPLPEPPKEE